MRRILTTAFLALSLPIAALSAGKSWTLSSPDGRIKADICSDGKVTYSVTFDGKTILAPSEIAMTLDNGIVFGEGKVRGVKAGKVDEKGLPAVAYKKATVDNVYNWLTLSFKDYAVEFRAFDNAVAYRFVSTARKGDYTVKSETAEFNFAEDWTSWVPFVISGDTFEKQFRTSFEHTYEHINLSAWNPKKLAFLPVVVDAFDGVKVLLTETDLRDYPGLFLNGQGGKTLKGINATYPKTVEDVSPRILVREREDYIAKFSASRSFPWRIVGIFEEEKDLLGSDLVWNLAAPADKGADWSWVKPGQAAWEWWSAWNVYGVDFKAGVNTETYKYFIDFASRFGLEYVLIDASWTPAPAYDFFNISPNMDMEELVRYGKEKNVGLILWTCSTAVKRDLEKPFEYYSKMGIKGFKVDFFDRDDQAIVDFVETIAKTAAKYHLLIDFHGIFKPSGLERTYPNIINYEGVYGLEQMKGGARNYDQVLYDVTVPFVRMAAGRMDYTQGAMINCSKGTAYPNSATPMSQGTRCRQIAEYVVFDSPLVMLCDSPTHYLAEPECTEFISSIPTIWDETVPLCGKIGEYVAVAHRKGNTWYVGAINDWNERDLELDLSFIGKGRMTIFQDGVNATKAAQDYKKVVTDIPSGGKVKIHMAPGGGWAASISGIQ